MMYYVYTQPIGFDQALSGVAYYDKWMTSGSYDNFGRKWVLSVSSPEYYYGNSIQLATNPWTPGTFATDSNFGINVGPYATSQSSTFACSEIIMIDRVLSSDEVKCVEDYLDDKYKLFAQSS